MYSGCTYGACVDITVRNAACVVDLSPLHLSVPAARLMRSSALNLYLCIPCRTSQTWTQRLWSRPAAPHLGQAARSQTSLQRRSSTALTQAPPHASSCGMACWIPGARVRLESACVWWGECGS